APPVLHSVPTRRSSDLPFRTGTLGAHPARCIRRRRCGACRLVGYAGAGNDILAGLAPAVPSELAQVSRRTEHGRDMARAQGWRRSEEHTSELQSREKLV